MNALVKEEPVEGYVFKRVERPKPTGKEALIRIEFSSICGSDLNLYAWNETATKIASLPFIPGHESVGIVEEVGPDVDPSSIQVGDRVAVENHFFCGDCFQCRESRRDLRHICQRMSQYGHGKGTTHGGMCEFSIVPAQYLYKLKTSLEPRLACLLEPFGVAQHAVEEVEVAGDSLLVLGAGAIGLFIVAVAKAYGATKVISVDIEDRKLEVAKQMGADVVVNARTDDVLQRVLEETGGDGAGCVIEASGAPSMTNTCFEKVRKGGRIVILGIPKGPIHIENPLPDFLFKSLTVKTIHGRKIFHTWEESERLLFEKRVNVDAVISHEFAFADFEEAFAALRSGKALKILLHP